MNGSDPSEHWSLTSNSNLSPGDGLNGDPAAPGNGGNQSAAEQLRTTAGGPNTGWNGTSSGDGGDGGNAEGRDHEEGTIGGGDGSDRDRLPGNDGRSSSSGGDNGNSSGSDNGGGGDNNLFIGGSFNDNTLDGSNRRNGFGGRQCGCPRFWN